MSCNIDCEWMRSKRIIVNPDGQVIPCCYLANTLYLGQNYKLPQKVIDDGYYYEDPMNYKYDEIEDQIGHVERIAASLHKKDIMLEYLADKEKYNLMHTPLDEILSSEWFTKTLPESWEDPTKLLWACKNFCSKDPKNG